MLRYVITLPPPPAIIDLVTRELRVTTVNPATLTPHTRVVALGKDATEGAVDLRPGVVAEVVLVDVDAFGNESTPSNPLTIDVSDTDPPPQPGDLAVAAVGVA